MADYLQGYSEFVNSCVDEKHVKNSRDRITLGALGLAGETGEVVDIIKKELMHGKHAHRHGLLLEFGDVFWYFTLLLRCYGFTLEEVIDANVEKLQARYPDRNKDQWENF